MNILEQSEALKDIPEAALMREMQMPTGSFPQYLVLTEIKRRKRIRDEFQRREAQDIPTVAEEAVMGAGMPQQGIMQMAKSMAPQTSMGQNTGVANAAPKQPTMGMAEGGITRLREGGKVIRMGGAEFALFDDGEVYRIAPNGRRFKAPAGLAKGVREFAAQAELLQEPAQAEEITSRPQYTSTPPDQQVKLPAELSPVTPSPTAERIAQNYPELATQSTQIAMEGVDTPASLEQIIAQGARNYGTKRGMPKGFMGDPRLQGGIVEEMRGTGMPAAAEPPEYIPSSSSPTGFINAKTGRPVSGSVAESLQSQQDQQDLLNPRAVGTVGFGFDDLTPNDLLRRQEGIDRREKERGERAEAFSREEGRFDPRPKGANFYPMDSILRDQQKQRAALGEGIMQGRAGPLTGASEEPEQLMGQYTLDDAIAAFQARDPSTKPYANRMGEQALLYEALGRDDPTGMASQLAGLTTAADDLDDVDDAGVPRNFNETNFMQAIEGLTVPEDILAQVTRSEQTAYSDPFLNPSDSEAKTTAQLEQATYSDVLNPADSEAEIQAKPKEIVDQSGQNLTDAFSFSNLTSGGLGGTPFVSAGTAKELIEKGSEEIDALSAQKQIQTINEQIAATDDPYMLEALRKKKSSLELLQRSGENIAKAADELNQAVGGVFNPNVAMNKLTSLDNRAAGNIAAFFGETDFAAEQFKRASEKQEAADNIVKDAEIKAAQRKEEIERNRVNRGSVPVLLPSPSLLTTKETEDVLSPLVAPDVELERIEKDAKDATEIEESAAETISKETQEKLKEADQLTNAIINQTGDTGIRAAGGVGTSASGVAKEALAQKGLNTDQWLAIAMIGAGLASGNPADIGKSVQAGLSYLQKDKQGKMAYDARMKEIASREKVAGIRAAATAAGRLETRNTARARILFDEAADLSSRASLTTNVSDRIALSQEAAKLKKQAYNLLGYVMPEGNSGPEDVNV